MRLRSLAKPLNLNSLLCVWRGTSASANFLPKEVRIAPASTTS